jgi:ABC-type branched-subunit amino acid transport system ATPase component
MLGPTQSVTTNTLGRCAPGGLRSDKIVQAGLVQVPEGREVLARMTVAENLMMGACIRRGPGRGEGRPRC